MQQRPERRVLAHVEMLPPGSPARHFVRRDPAADPERQRRRGSRPHAAQRPEMQFEPHRIARRQQLHRLRPGQRTQRRDVVQDPERAAMRPGHQVARP